MNLQDLNYFVALAKHRHCGKATDACYVSQPMNMRENVRFHARQCKSTCDAKK